MKTLATLKVDRSFVFFFFFQHGNAYTKKKTSWCFLIRQLQCGMRSQSSHRLSGLPFPFAAYFVLINSRRESMHVTLNLSEWSRSSVAPVILLSKESTHSSWMNSVFLKWMVTSLLRELQCGQETLKSDAVKVHWLKVGAAFLPVTIWSQMKTILLFCLVHTAQASRSTEFWSGL